jgi:hypothetical protein
MGNSGNADEVRECKKIPENFQHPVDNGYPNVYFRKSSDTGGAIVHVRIPQFHPVALILVTCALVSEAGSQPLQLTLLRGVVRDSADARPVEGAIVYIPNSNLGASSDSSGRFVLPAPPGTELTLVISRVGYRRRILTLRTGAGDTTALEILLAPSPVQAPGVEISAEPGRLPPAGPPQFFPSGSERSWCAYGSETEIPVGILFTEAAMYMYALETAALGGERYVRLWLLMFNGSDDTLLFDPATDVRLDVHRGRKLYRNIHPLSAAQGRLPDSILSVMRVSPTAPERTIDVLANQKSIFNVGAFIADIRATTHPGSTPHPWLGWLNPPEHPSGVNPAHLKEVFDRCTHEALLGRYRLAPSTGVDGCLWYPLPGFPGPEGGGTTGAEYIFKYHFTLRTPSGGEEGIVFDAH